MLNLPVNHGGEPSGSDAADATTNSCCSRKRGTCTLIPYDVVSPPDLKKSKSCITDLPQPQSSKSSTTTISDLPDCIVFEILCRLPPIKPLFRCKCVSKRWFNLMSDTNFVSRILERLGTPTEPILISHVICCSNDHKVTSLTSTRTYSSKLPGILSMKFLPVFQDLKLQPFSTPIVEAIFNDLVLCCATKYYQRDYYICNPMTKLWVALPPTPRVHNSKVPVGFICDPYCPYQGNADYRWAVVRIVPDYTSVLRPSCSLEIFSSEIGEWRLFQLEFTTSINYFDYFNKWRPGVACNGKLYWYNLKGFTLEVDPYSVIECPRIASPERDLQLDVCQGRLQIYPSFIEGSITIWELRKENSSKLKWCKIFDSVPMSDMVSEDPKITKEKSGKLDVLGFLPSNADIIYLKFPQQIVMCNLRENTLKKSPHNPPINIGFDFSSYVGGFSSELSASIYKYVLPWWPSPVPKIKKPKASQQEKVLKRFEISLVQLPEPQSPWHHARRLATASWVPDHHPC